MKNKPIGIIGAMDCEIEYLTGLLSDIEKINIYGYTFYTGTISNKNIVIVKCGIGKVNAARGSQLMIDRFEPDVIINTGIAGGVGPDMEIGDAVIASKLLQHDFDVTPFGYAKGYMFYGDTDTPTFYESDKKTAVKLKKAALEILPSGTVKEGLVASGDQFIASTEKRQYIFNTFGAIAAEMEGAAIAQTAFFAGIPFSVLRVMSDKGDGTASGNYAEFEKKTAIISAKILEKFIAIY